jgi:hypothetical protein
MNFKASRCWLCFVILAMGVALYRVDALTNARTPSKSLSFHDDFTSEKLVSWQLPYPEDWEILREGPRHFLHMKRNREPGVPRRPLQFALLKDANVGSFQLQTEVRREGRSMIVVFNCVDTLHFYYVHLSRDRGTDVDVHNGIFIVNGEARKRIAGLEAPPALPDTQWHRVRLVRDAKSGAVTVFVDGQTAPLFSVVDRTFTCGQIGLGSFDETGDFSDVNLESQDAACVSGPLLSPARGN